MNLHIERRRNLLLHVVPTNLLVHHCSARPLSQYISALTSHLTTKSATTVHFGEFTNTTANLSENPVNEQPYSNNDVGNGGNEAYTAILKKRVHARSVYMAELTKSARLVGISVGLKE